VDQVHHVLGRHRSDEPRSGWISGLGDAEGEAHPTLGGLRIGKGLNERRAGERSDELLEWEQDGQYFHYLTKWMHALGRASRVTGETVYGAWAVELAQAAHAAFTSASSRGGDGRMYWKMSIDLTRPLVPSMGQHDPLDGYVAYTELQALAPRHVLAAEIVAMDAICRGRDWVSDDPLGIGGLLSDAWRIAQLTDLGLFRDKLLLESVIDAALAGLAAFTKRASLRIPAAYRLAFRELGLAIGLKGITPLRDWAEKSNARTAEQTPLQRKIAALSRYLPLAGEIEDFWLEESNREAGTWREHREINMVMLATTLAPDGFLSI
jgi:hypothetical protein